MRVLLDTNVLIAAFFPDHQHHEPSYALVAQCKNKDGFICAHSLAEFYATVTRMPPPFRAEPQQAWQGLQPIIKRFTLIAPKAEDYGNALSMLAQQNMGGAVIYDAMILSCAEQKKIDIVYTWNIKHFTRLPHKSSLKILTPAHAR